MPDHLTDSERALREAAEKATKGEWETDSLGIAIHTPKSAGASPGWVPVISNNVPDDAAYIVAAQPQRVIALLDEIERLRKAASLVEFWFAPWGAYKSAKWEELSGDRPFTVEVMLDLVRAALAPKEKNDG